MTRHEFNAFCATLPGTTHIKQWGGADVWKVGGKVFAIGGTAGKGLSCTFKASPVAYEMLKEQPGLRPAPYLAARGMKWIQLFSRTGLTDAALKDYIRQSHRLVAEALPRKQQVALGLDFRR